MNLRDDRGVLSLFGLMLTLVATALVLGIVAVGRTLVLREGMQDAADAAAFSSAVMHARGMNLLAFINLVMAALVAVLVALRLAQTLFVIAALVLAAAAWISGGATAAPAAASTKQAMHLQQAFERAKNAIFPVLRALHVTERAVSVVVPWVATTDALVEASNHHPPADGAFALPGSLRLPVEPDEFPVLCEHSTEMAVSLATAPLRLFIPHAFLDAITDGAGEMGRSLSGFLCGDGKGEPPSYTKTIDEMHPRPPGLDQCQQSPDSAPCRSARATLDDARPDERDGTCRTRPHCDYDDPYEALARTARRTCRPVRPKEYTWQRHLARVKYQYLGGRWVEVERQLTEPRLRTTEDPPCGPGGSIDRGWEADSGPRGASFPVPLCQENDRDWLPLLAEEGETREHTVEQATRIFSCIIEVDHEIPLADQNDAFGEGGDQRSPHRVLEDLTLGDDGFQIRAVAFGDRPSGGRFTAWAEQLAPEDDTNLGLTEVAGQLGRLSVAQAEFYFDHAGDAPHAEWLWDLRWTARLRRFRMPSGEAAERQQERIRAESDRAREDVAQFGGRSEHTTQSACQEAKGEDCETMDGNLAVLDRLVLH